MACGYICFLQLRHETVAETRIGTNCNDLLLEQISTWDEISVKVTVPVLTAFEAIKFWRLQNWSNW